MTNISHTPNYPDTTSRATRAAWFGMAVGAIALGALTSAPASGQCTFLIQDTFRLGLRAHGGSGSPRNIVLGESLTGYWPLTPAHLQWNTVNVSGQPTWIWAATSLDPMEVDPLDPSNGTAFSGSAAGGIGHPAALLPLSPPSTGPYTMSIDVVLGFNQPEPFFVGFTSSGAVTDNLLANGVLWMSLTGTGLWNVYANGTSTQIASGGGVFGQLGSGWDRLELTYDPTTSTVSGHAGSQAFGPVIVTLTQPISFVGFESHGNFFNAVNNFMVRTGPSVAVSVGPPAGACPGSSLTLSASTNAAPPSSIVWMRDGAVVADGPFQGVATASGANTATLVITPASGATSGSYQCVVSSACGTAESTPVQVAFCPVDFDCSGSANVGDIFAFLVAWFGGNPSADFNGAGGVNVTDIFAFLTAWFAGCS